jgi:hypothetical protein
LEPVILEGDYWLPLLLALGLLLVGGGICLWLGMFRKGGWE